MVGQSDHILHVLRRQDCQDLLMDWMLCTRERKVANKGDGLSGETDGRDGVSWGQGREGLEGFN